MTYYCKTSCKGDPMKKPHAHLTRYINRLRDRIRLNPTAFKVYTVLRILVIVTLVINLVNKRFENAFMCVLSLFLFLLPSFFEKQLKIEIPPLFEIFIYCFIFSAEILGEINHFYTLIPGWDTILHTLNGFLCAAIGFALVDLLNRHSENFNLSPIYLAFTAFCFSMTVGVLWEFCEFATDQLFLKDMQKDFVVRQFASVTLDKTNQQIPVPVKGITKTIIETKSGKEYVIEGGYLDIGIIDTMKDLIVNFIGAVVFSIIGYLYVKGRDKTGIAKKLIIYRHSEEELQEIDAFIDRQEEKRSQKQKKIADNLNVRKKSNTKA